MEKGMTREFLLVSPTWILRGHSSFGKSSKVLFFSIFLVYVATEKINSPITKTANSSILETTNSLTSETTDSSISETSISETTISSMSNLPKSPQCTFISDKEDVVIDCRNQGLTKLPRNAIPSSVVELYLDNNNFSDLPDNTFDNFTQLKVLSVSVNRLEYIGPLAFMGLDHLEHLNLQRNKLNLSGSMWDQKPFKYLQKLKTLNLSSNVNELIGGKYNKDLLGGLQNVYELTLDTFYGDLNFGEIFLNLTSLKSLVLTGYAKCLLNTTFESLKPLGLEKLSLKVLTKLNTIELDSFSPLTKLESLSISYTFIGVNASLRSLYPFRNRTMKNLNFHNIASPYSDGATLVSDGTLDHNKTEFLSQICVENFVLTDSKVYVVQKDVITGPLWRHCVHTMDISNNKLIGDVPAVFELSRFKKLRILDFAYRRTPCNEHSNLPTLFVGDIIVNNNLYRNTEDIELMPSTNLEDESDTNNFAHSHRKSSDIVNGRHHNEYDLDISQENTFLSQLLNDTVIFFLPKTLEVLNAASTIEDWFDVLAHKYIFHGGERLREVYLSDNNFRNFTGTIKGLSGLKVLDLSYNDCSTIHKLFFQFMTTIEVLKMRGTKLNGEFMSEPSQRLFRPLTNLTVIDLSDNNLRLLSPDIFVKNSLIWLLILSQNRFRNIPVDISYFRRLSHLDMSFNSITQLSQSEMQSLDEHSKKVSTFTMRLGGNVMSCGCSSIRYLVWLRNTKVNLDKPLNFKCINEDGIKTTIGEIGDTKTLWLLCHGRLFFLLSVILFCLVIIGFVVTISCIKFKTRLKSFIYRMVLDEFAMKSPADFRFGVFIDYADVDTRFACFTLRDFIQSELRLSTYVRDINLIPASDFAETVVDVVNSSWRIVFLITADFLDREWSYFTMKTAAYVVGPSNPHQVVVLVEDRVRHRLPACLLHAVEEDNIVSISSTQVLTYEVIQRLSHLIQPQYAYD